MSSTNMAITGGTARRHGGPLHRGPAHGPLVLVVIALAWSSATLHAAAPNQPVAIVHHSIDEALAVLRDPHLQGPAQRKQRYAKLREIADQAFDWAQMAQTSLGAPWRTITTQQRKRFTQLFRSVLANYYLDRIDQFQGDEKVVIKGSMKSGDETTVKTVLTTHSGDEVPIAYHMRKKAGSWVVYDVSIEGVSLANNYRDTFRRFLVNHTFGQLLDKLSRTSS